MEASTRIGFSTVIVCLDVPSVVKPELSPRITRPEPETALVVTSSTVLFQTLIFAPENLTLPTATILETVCIDTSSTSQYSSSPVLAGKTTVLVTSGSEVATVSPTAQFATLPQALSPAAPVHLTVSVLALTAMVTVPSSSVIAAEYCSRRLRKTKSSTVASVVPVRVMVGESPSP